MVHYLCSYSFECPPSHFVFPPTLFELRRTSRRYSLRRCAAKAGAGEGNRTLVISLEGCCSTIELHPPSVYEIPSPLPPRRPAFSRANWWRGLDSNQRRRKANRFTVCPLDPLGHSSGGTGNYVVFQVVGQEF